MPVGRPFAPDASTDTPRDGAVAEQTLEFVLSGELDLSNAPALTNGLLATLEGATQTNGKPARMVLDLQNLTFIDAAGIQALVSTKRRCVKLGAYFALRLGDTQVRRMLTKVGITDFLETDGLVATGRPGRPG